MRLRHLSISVLLTSAAVHAQEVASPDRAQAPITLAAYLEQVKAQNPEARALVGAVKANELRLDEADLPLTPNLYADFAMSDDKNEPTNPVSPARAKATTWRAGIKDQTLFGLSSDVYVQNNHVSLLGVNKQFFPLSDYYDTVAGVQLRQALWANGFGAASRGEFRAKQAENRRALLEAKMKLKNILLNAENTYWSVVSYSVITRLQEENVDRARRLRDLMRKREESRLVDDVDALQAQASFDKRELDLMTSRDARASYARAFNTLRGFDNDEIGPLAELPTAEVMIRTVKDSSKQMTREDFRAIFEAANALKGAAEARGSRVAPQLDLVAGIATNGLDVNRSPAFSEMERFNNPTMSVGVQFSVPLDYSLIRDLRRSHRADQRQAEDLRAQAKFAEQRTWDDLQKKKSEVQSRFEKALTLEGVQTRVVKLERQRLVNGRTTTFQTLQMENDLAGIQVDRVVKQLELMQLHNVLKTFEVQ